MLGGCAQIGDFDRPRPSVLSSYKAAWFGKDNAAPGHVDASLFALTDDEKLLRQFADPLLSPPPEPVRWHGYLAAETDAPLVRPTGFDRTEYGRRLTEMPYRSATARYSRLMDDIRNDAVRIDPFAETARRVADIDRKREQSLTYVSALSEGERANAQRRMRENAAIMAQVHRSLSERAMAYHYALERLVVSTPSPVAVEAERALTDLRSRISGVRTAAS